MTRTHTAGLTDSSPYARGAWTRRPLPGALCLAIALLAAGPTAADDRSQAWIEGFAAGSLDREFGIAASDVELRGQMLHVWIAPPPAQLELDTVVRSLLDIEGVEEVLIRNRTDGMPLAHGTADPDQPQRGGAVADRSKEFELFPSDELFAPLQADPRWPRFAVTYQWYLGDPELTRVGSASFGETFPLIRIPLDAGGHLEFGIQGGVFSIFDLDATSLDLVNSDFLGALFASYRVGPVAATLRLYHQSSHLGDEFVLRNRANRVNLSFEVLDILASYDPTSWLRFYGGAGVLVHREPALERWQIQTGVEVESPTAFGGWLRPLASLDLQFREESDWDEDVSVRWGVQIEHPRLQRMKLRLLGEYYRGRSPNGQFFVRRIETLGVGLHADF